MAYPELMPEFTGGADAAAANPYAEAVRARAAKMRAGVGAAPTATSPAVPGFLARNAGLFRFGAAMSAGVPATLDAAGVMMDPNKTLGEAIPEAGLNVAKGAGAAAGAALGMRVPGPWWAKMMGATAGALAPDLAQRATEWFRSPGAASPAVVHDAGPRTFVDSGALADGTVTDGIDPTSFVRMAPADPNALPAVAPMTAADIRGTMVPTRGTGAFVNNSTGAVTNLDTRAQGFGAASAAPGYAPGTVGSYVGAVLNQRREAQGEARSAARDKLTYEFLSKLPAAEHASAQAGEIQNRQKLAADYLAAHPGDSAGAAVVASGRALPHDTYAVTPSVTGNDIIATSRQTGASTISTPRRVGGVLKGSDGNYYEDHGGTPGRKLTAEEVAKLPKK